MNIGIIGLGRMGMAIAERAARHGHQVVGYDPSNSTQEETERLGIVYSNNLADVCKTSRIIWLMVPAGQVVDDVIAQLIPHVQPGDIIIDGGNSFYKDSIRRYAYLAQKEISFIDCGTSGGLEGRKLGFSLMIGGDKNSYDIVLPLFQAIAYPNGYQYLGPAGAGHYIKMVHNGIEYAQLQAYAEGFQLIKEGPYKNLDLKNIAHVWNHGSIIRSWILELAERIFARDQEFDKVSGNIGENLTGKWTTQVADELGVPVRVIHEALAIRAWSRETGGNYATKIVAMLRHEFGGHEVKKI